MSHNKDSIEKGIKNGELKLVSSRVKLQKTPWAHAFNVAMSTNDESIIEDWYTCILCSTWINVPKSHGSNPFKRHVNKCKFDGYAFLDPASLAALIGNCLRFGGIKIKSDDLKKSFESYPAITKEAM